MNCPLCDRNLSPALLAIQGKPQQVVDVYDVKLTNCHELTTKPVTIICVKRTTPPKEPLKEPRTG